MRNASIFVIIVWIITVGAVRADPHDKWMVTLYTRDCEVMFGDESEVAFKLQNRSNANSDVLNLVGLRVFVKQKDGSELLIYPKLDNSKQIAKADTPGFAQVMVADVEVILPLPPSIPIEGPFANGAIKTQTIRPYDSFLMSQVIPKGALSLGECHIRITLVLDGQIIATSKEKIINVSSASTQPSTRPQPEHNKGSS